MITKLPVALPALADEPGFSLLARNAHANASATTQEFCSAVGLSKAQICSGHPAELARLATLTKSCFDKIEYNSPRVADRKFTFLSNRTFLSRSLRKAKQRICPVCWQKDLEISRTALHLRQQWLLEPIHTCLKHSSVLIPLPFIDYTSCYDHIMRAEHNVRWLGQLERLQKDQTPTTFEVAAIEHLRGNPLPCQWLGNTQIDTLERWSIGLGMLLENRTGRPEDLSKEERRKLASVGFDVTVQGRSQVDIDVDAALGRYQIRLGKTWLQSWACQSAHPPERRIFRELMKDLFSNQGRYCLVNVSKGKADERLVISEITKIAQETNRSTTWVRRALRREKLLTETGVPQSRDLVSYMRKCRSYILAVVDSLDATKSAARLNIGIKGFESLVEGGLISPMKNHNHKCDRFIPTDLDQLWIQLDNNLLKCADAEDKRLTTIADACFLYHLTTAQVTRLLVAGLLPSSRQIAGIQGFLGVRVKRNEVAAAMKVFTDDQIAPRALSHHLGLTFDQLRSLRELQLLPNFPAPTDYPYRSQKSIGKTVLARFLVTYQTVTTAARHLRIEKNELRSKIARAGIQPAKEGAGLPIYYRSDLID